MPILWTYSFLELKFVEHIKNIWHIRIVYCDGVIVYDLIRKITLYILTKKIDWKYLHQLDQMFYLRPRIHVMRRELWLSFQNTLCNYIFIVSLITSKRETISWWDAACLLQGSSLRPNVGLHLIFRSYFGLSTGGLFCGFWHTYDYKLPL